MEYMDFYWEYSINGLSGALMRIVTLSASCANYKSQNLRGLIAARAVKDNEDRTLCSYCCAVWMWLNLNGETDFR